MKEFEDNPKNFSLLNLEKWISEIIPVKEFEETSKTDNSGRLPRVSGRVPFS